MSDTPETDDQPIIYALNELQDIHRWIERNHPDGFIDSLTFSQNLERVADRWYDRFDIAERERDQARYLLKHAQSALDAIHLEIGGWIKTMSVTSK